MLLSLYLPGSITRDILHPFRISLKGTSCPKDDLVNNKSLHRLMAAPELMQRVISGGHSLLKKDERSKNPIEGHYIPKWL